MVLGSGALSWTSLMIVSAVVMFIWVLREFHRFRHKLYGLFIITFIIFLYVGFVIVSQTNQLDFSTAKGLLSASKIYLSWMVSVFKNLGAITSNAIHLNWAGNGTA